MNIKFDFVFVCTFLSLCILVFVLVFFASILSSLLSSSLDATKERYGLFKWVEHTIELNRGRGLIGIVRTGRTYC